MLYINKKKIMDMMIILIEWHDVVDMFILYHFRSLIFCKWLRFSDTNV